MSKTVLFQAIQFSISTLFSSIWPIDRTLSGATTPGQSRPGGDGNEGVFHIPQSSSITEVSLSDCLVSYPGHSLRESYPSGGLSTFRSLRELLSGFVSTNIKQILQTRKQMECDNNKN